MPTTNNKAIALKIAKALRKAIENREASWDGEHYALRVEDAIYATFLPNDLEDFAQLAYLATRAWWNDAKDWCDQMINEEKV